MKFSPVMPAGGRARDTRVQVRAVLDQLPGEVEAGHGARPLRRRPVAAGDACLAHPGQLVQGGPAAWGGVRVGAAVQQIGSQLVVGAADGQQKRVQSGIGGPTSLDATGGQGRVDGQLLVEVRAGLQQGLDDIDLSLARREQQRGEPTRRPCAQIGAVGRQGGDDRRVAFGRGPHQCRLGPPVFVGVDVGTRVQQQRHGVDAARSRRGHQRRLAFHQRGVRVGARLQQRSDDGAVSDDTGQ